RFEYNDDELGMACSDVSGALERGKCLSPPARAGDWGSRARELGTGAPAFRYNSRGRRSGGRDGPRRERRFEPRVRVSWSDYEGVFQRSTLVGDSVVQSRA